MDKELRQLQQFFNSPDIRVVKCGIGKVNAALGAQRLINEFQPDVVISTGCAGGHGDGICVQDVVVSTELAYHDVYCGNASGITVYGQVQGMPARYQADPILLQKALKLNSSSLLGQNPSSLLPPPSSNKIHPGLIVTGDWFVDSKDKMRDILSHFPDARAVDMESAALAQTCLVNRVRFISFRVISDIPLHDTDAAMYHDFWNTIAEQSFQVTRSFINTL